MHSADATLMGSVRLASSIVKVSGDEHMAKINALDSQISKLTEVFIIDLHIDTSKRVLAMHALLTSLHEPMKRLVDGSSISMRNLKEI